MAKNLIEKKIPSLCLRMIDLILKLTIAPFIKKKSIPSPNAILISQPAHLGDVILATSLLPLIKKRFPSVKIGFVVSSKSRFIIDGHPSIDYIHTVDHWKLNRSAMPFREKLAQYQQSRKNALQEIKKIGYDIAVDLPFHFPNLSSLFWQAKIPYRIGFTTAGLSPLLTHPVTWIDKDQSAAHYFASLLDPITRFEKPNLKPHLCVKEKNIPFAPHSYYIIHMGSGHEMKEWPKEKWRALVERMSDKTLIFTGVGAKENRIIQYVISNHKNCHNYCDKLSWNDLLLFVKQAIAIIGVDTSIGHAAASFDIPSYLIYSGIHRKALWAPLSDKAKIITFPVTCSPCRTGCKAMSCINDIEVEHLYKMIHGK